VKHCFGKVVDTIKAYKDGENFGYSYNHAVTLNNGLLYSRYSSHPMAVRMKDSKGTWILLNDDSFNSWEGSLSSHFHLIYSLFHEYPRISFSTALAANILRDIFERKVELIDFTHDIYDEVDEFDKDFDRFEDKFPPGTEFTYKKELTNINSVYIATLANCFDCGNNYGTKLKIAHRVESVVLYVKPKGYFLCTIDEGQHFIFKLPRKVKSVNEAFTALTPKEILKAKQQRIHIQRQGEWFFFRYSNNNFLPKYLKEKISSTPKKDYVKLVLQSNPNGNSYILTNGIIVKKFVVGWGALRHSANTHRMLKLPREGGEQPWVGITNRAKGSWSSDGR